MAPVLKTGVPKGTAGSNPVLSAISLPAVSLPPRRAQVRAQTAQHPAHQLGMPALPAVLHVQVHHRRVRIGEAQLDQRLMAVFLLAHDEDAVRPLKELAGEGVL